MYLRPHRPAKAGFRQRLVHSVKLVVLSVSVTGAMIARKTEPSAVYLRSPGPPPLRFQKTFPLDPYLKQQLFPAKIDALANTNAAVLAHPTNDIAIYPPTNGIPTISSAMTTNGSSDPLNFLPSPSSASDLLSVNPQLLVEYLKPVQDGTNQNLVVPAEVRFLPPTPGVPAESRAIYKNQ